VGIAEHQSKLPTFPNLNRVWPSIRTSVASGAKRTVHALEPILHA